MDEEAKEGEASQVQYSSLQRNGYSRDHLQGYRVGNHRLTDFAAANEDTEEMELNLGLSFGGRFGVDPREKKLVRSSSIAGLMTPVRNDDGAASLPVAYPALIIRTCSLPTETDQEEWRKRKELQSLRRKRKRSEKQRNFRACKDRAPWERNCEDEDIMAMNLTGKVEGCPGNTGSVVAGKQQQIFPSVEPPFQLPSWASAARGAVLGRGMDTRNKINGDALAGAASQGSISSEISEFESRSVQESSSCTDARSPASVRSLPDLTEQKPLITRGITKTKNSGKFGGVEMENSSKKHKVVDKRVKGEGRNVVVEMPSVSTRGDGPNGRRIKGFLYNYRKGEEVCIVCVCHGSVLSPVDFVKHAGGGDVAHPLRHILVSHSSTSFLQ
ncbi:hypothetical protein HHK36_032821 [Tetracentron sinense]|uniref:Ninja-family protein n=1 Tax=Tetracentron sinense TaxID=13715 RepID=A0A834Y6D1_TETSI|nr:hypothetical protein HHK36_032821 [Tetracentron sinense]